MNFVVSLLSFPHFYFMEVLKLLRVVKTTLIKAQTMEQYNLPNKVLRNKHTHTHKNIHTCSYKRYHYYNRIIENYPRLLIAGKKYVFTHDNICTIFVSLFNWYNLKQIIKHMQNSMKSSVTMMCVAKLM